MTNDLKTIEKDGLRLYVTPDGNKYPSVTTILGATSDQTWLKEWRERVGDAEADRVSKIATDRGSDIHSCIEAYLKGEKLTPEYPFTKYMLMNAWKDLNRITDVVCQEIALYSDKAKIAGRVDCIGKFDDILSVIDFKTSKTIKDKSDILDYFIQSTMYAYMYYERTGIKISDVVIFILNECEKPTIYKSNTKLYTRHMINRIKKFYSTRNHNTIQLIK